MSGNSGNIPVNQDELESQLSAMFDGELPTAECELLSRRLDRDPELRTRWARYALIGAAMRCEPVATARSDFAARVSSAVDRATRGGREGAARGRRSLLWQGALAATLVGAVAGLSILMLRNVAMGPSVRAALAGVAVVGAPAVAPAASGVASARAVAARSLPALATAGEDALTRAREAAAVLGVGDAVRQPGPATIGSHEPWSYVTPRPDASAPTGLRTELVDYIVAHSEYSTPLVRPDLLSELIGGEEAVDATPAQSASGR